MANNPYIPVFLPQQAHLVALFELAEKKMAKVTAYRLTAAPQ